MTSSRRLSKALASTLGFGSVGLGMAEVVQPGAVARLAGVTDTPSSRRVIRALGVRECGHGAAVLFGSPRLVWTRVVGDALDVALLGWAMRGSPGAGGRRGAMAMTALAAIGVADVYVSRRMASVAG